MSLTKIPSEFFRSKNPKEYKEIKNGKDLIFQALEWQSANEEYANDTNTTNVINDINDDEQENKKKSEKFIVRIFGVTQQGNSICLNVLNYTPFFYIKIPQFFKSKHINALINYVEMRLLKYYPGTLIKNKCITQERIDFYGFTNSELCKFTRFVFTNSEAMKYASYIFNKNILIPEIDPTKKYFLKTYESKVDPIIRFIHSINVSPCGWIKVDSDYLTSSNHSTCQLDYECEWFDIDPIDANDKLNDSIAPILQASFDIETYSHDGNFPDANHIKNSIITIATTFKIYGQEKFLLKHAITLKKCNEIQEDKKEENNCCTVVESYDTEKEVLMAWKKLIYNMDPDILYTYNGDQFDCNYLIIRSKKLGIFNKFNRLSRLPLFQCDIKEETFSSSAYGHTNYSRLQIPGRINFDILINLKRELKLESYKLDNVSKEFLKKKDPVTGKEIFEQKNEMPPRMLFDYFESGDPEKIRLITEYCIQDTLLPQKLVDKLCILPNQIEMSNITYVPFRYLFERGQQIKSFSLIIKKTKKFNYLIPDKQAQNNDSYTGATVVPPKPGAYFDTPVTTLDFMSLYPTIMMAYNLCYSTIILNPKYAKNENLDIYKIEWTDKDKLTGEDVKFSYSFVQNKKGLLPLLLDELFKSRKAVKKLMKGEKDPFKYSVLNGRQLAIKVSMNSVYGFLAAQTIQCKPIAACVTTRGRQMIDETIFFVENNFVKIAKLRKLIDENLQINCEVIYGDTDSVFVLFKTDKRGVDAMIESMKLGKICADLITEMLFRYPIVLEFEKTYSKLLLFKKKMYIGALHEDDPVVPKCIDKKGVALKRRDNCHLVKHIYQGTIDIIMKKEKKGIKEAIQFIRNECLKLIDGKIDLDDLIITKSLKTNYKNKNQAHVILAQKIAQRNPGSEPRSGDRIPYIFIDNGKPKDKQYNKSEDPEYFIEYNKTHKNKLKLDTYYYINGQIKNPLIQLFSVLVQNPEDIFKEVLIKAKNKQNNQKNIYDYFK